MYDFIVVGAGPAGCLLANRLAQSAKRPEVLLVEAGGRNDLKSSRIDAERWLHRLDPALSWGYQTTPQKHMGGMVLPYDRGKGLGGSSAINFSCWTIGPKDDYDQLAKLTGDDEWSWSNAQARYKRIESYFGCPPHVPQGIESYLHPRADDHGTNGPIKVGFPKVWEKSTAGIMDICYANGIQSNPDVNSGQPLGLGMMCNSANKGVRSTAADALVGAPSNLHIKTGAEVARVVIKGTKAIGIMLMDGTVIHATKEVILSTGSLDTPRILMHSGIGPEDQLQKFNLPVICPNNNVGQALRDHIHTFFNFERSDGLSERQYFFKDKAKQDAARTKWETDQTGPLAEMTCSMGIGFFKLDAINVTAEYQALPSATRTHLELPTMPIYEIIVDPPLLQYYVDPKHAPAAAVFCVVLLSLQSHGTVTLQSSDPQAPLSFDPNLFANPYDERLAIEATRDLFKIVNSKQFQQDTIRPIDGPASGRDEDILEFWKRTTSTTWHVTGTAVMGKSAEVGVVDSSFQVFGIQQLRIADMSVYPLLPSAHTQTTAYLAGLTLGDKLVQEYNLE